MSKCLTSTVRNCSQASSETAHRRLQSTKKAQVAIFNIGLLLPSSIHNKPSQYWHRSTHSPPMRRPGVDGTHRRWPPEPWPQQGSLPPLPPSSTLCLLLCCCCCSFPPWHSSLFFILSFFSSQKNKIKFKFRWTVRIKVIKQGKSVEPFGNI